MKHNHREGDVKDYDGRRWGMRRWGMRKYARTRDNRSRRRIERSILLRVEIEDMGSKGIEDDLIFPKKGKVDPLYYLD